MKPMIATNRRGTRSSRIASSRSWKGVVNVSSSATWTESQLFSTTVVAQGEALAADAERYGPEVERGDRLTRSQEDDRDRGQQEGQRNERAAHQPQRTDA